MTYDEMYYDMMVALDLEIEEDELNEDSFIHHAPEGDYTYGPDGVHFVVRDWSE